MKVWKKLSAVALALVMVMALCVMASADNTNSLTNGGVESNSDKSSVGTTINIPKAITVHGTQTQVYSPTITYTYAIAPVATSALTNINVTDTATNTGKVKEGPSGGVSLTDSTAVFTSASTNLSGEGADKTALVSDTITVSVDLTQFKNTTYGPGVYRYAITANNDTAVAAAGVTANGAATRDDRYLDVYIKNGTTDLEVYGYVLLTANDSVTSATTTKSNGFTTDNYYTIDVTLTKSITGDAANKTHQFPFDITVSNPSSSGYLYAKGTATLTDSVSTALAAASSTTLADGEVFHIYGLNPLATVTYVEHNDTPDTYKVTVTGDNSTTIVAQTDIAPAATQATSALTVSDYVVSTASTTQPTASNNAAVTFTNNLEAISPTGVVLRYAPYMAMMGAGIVALPLSLRKKEELD